MPSSEETRLRWQRWQQTPLVERNLARGTSRESYTVLYVPVYLREAFLATVTLFLARRRVDSTLTALLDTPDRLPPLQEAQAQWEAWQRWTRRLAAYLERVALGKEGTLPEVPGAFHDALDAVRGSPDA
jgi:hypothetical protein